MFMDSIFNISGNICNILSIIAIVIIIFIIVYAIRNKGKENFLLLGICFFLPAIIFAIELIFADYPADKITTILKGLLTFAMIYSLFFSIYYFVNYFKGRKRN